MNDLKLFCHLKTVNMTPQKQTSASHYKISFKKKREINVKNLNFKFSVDRRVSKTKNQIPKIKKISINNRYCSNIKISKICVIHNINTGRRRRSFMLIALTNLYNKMWIFSRKKWSINSALVKWMIVPTHHVHRN